MVKSGNGKAIIAFGVLALVFTIVMALVSVSSRHAFVIPEFRPTTYANGGKVTVWTNKITSVRTQIPYNYHNLPVCRQANAEDKDDKSIKKTKENLGEIVLGDSIETSLYKLEMRQTVKCHLLCKKHLTVDEVKDWRNKIQEEYKAHWLIDLTLPSASRIGKQILTKEQEKKITDPDHDTFAYEVGFAIGARQKDENDEAAKKFSHLNNHVDIFVHYNEVDDGNRIVFFEVNPRSIAYKNAGDVKNCDATHHAPFDVSEDKETDVFFTYNVNWSKSNIKWSERWDKYLTMNGDGQIHWFSIINSLMIVLFLSGMVAMIMMRTLHAEITRINSTADVEEPDETGWKFVYADVFRPPRYPMLFSVLVGSGMQVTGMFIVVMVFAVLGILSPANKGALTMSMLVLFVWMGIVAGYFSTRTYKNLGGEKWKRNALLTALFFPGIFFGTFFFLSCFLWGMHSSAGIPFSALLALIALWFGISVPLCFFGSYFAWRREKVKPLCEPKQIPRHIPVQVWYMHPIFSVLMGGILPFGAVFIELFFILSSIWLHRFYYLFGFLFLVFIILVITCAEITIVMCYFQLCSEDYHWWWRSYMTSGASAFYMFLYSIFYFATTLHISGFVPVLLYFGYSFMMCFAFFVCTGSIGYYACSWFVNTIYGAVSKFQ